MSDTFTFFTDTISYKTVLNEEGDKRYYIEGYASTGDLDLVNDVVTPNGLKSLLEQIKGKTIKLDLEHEAWKNNPDLLPAGKIIDAKIDKKGLFITAEINKHHPNFKTIWNSVKDNFLDAFSIAYTVTKQTFKEVGGKTIRLLDDLTLLNVALTGNPANPEANISRVFVKSMNIMEVNTMAETTTPTEIKPEPITVPVENVEIKNLQALTAELKEKLAGIETFATEQKSFNEKFGDYAQLKERLDAAEKALIKPQLKAKQETMPVELASKILNPLDLIR